MGWVSDRVVREGCRIGVVWKQKELSERKIWVGISGWEDGRWWKD